MTTKINQYFNIIHKLRSVTNFWRSFYYFSMQTKIAAAAKMKADDVKLKKKRFLG